ncbi:hypothetical protein [Microbacterium sp. W4I20]|uniref:hypothetical protein n=1 Tax=Microbacterium sp. W4I20 TaxID=3042262 RepID=UPI0027873CBC|nr:hypothetical protein [Microbacterium sp. W4I20]MDQ0726851.1 hypothetical protein [Microbacterium sp. W4I20]
MDRNQINSDIARRVNSAICEAGADVRIVARAADITISELDDRLNGRAEFQIDELVHVGGFLRIPATRFMKEAA